MTVTSARWSDVDWTCAQRVTLVPFADDVGGWVLARAGGRLILPHGPLLPDDDAAGETTLRLGLDYAGFRRQGYYPFATQDAGAHVAVWCSGARYFGDRPHVQAEWWHGDAATAARLLTEQGDPEWAELVTRADAARRSLTDEEFYAATIAQLGPAYLAGSTPQAGSGFGGSDEDWRAARSVLCEAIPGDCTFLDVGCANGYLMESIVAWSAEQGVRVEPYGVDINADLVAEARRRLPQWADRLWVGNAVSWTPPGGRRFDVVHTLLDCVPEHAQQRMIQHLLDAVVAPGGRLLVSAYVSIDDTRRHARAVLERHGFTVAGETGPGQRADRLSPPSAWVLSRRNTTRTARATPHHDG